MFKYRNLFYLMIALIAFFVLILANTWHTRINIFIYSLVLGLSMKFAPKYTLWVMLMMIVLTKAAGTWLFGN